MEKNTMGTNGIINPMTVEIKTLMIDGKRMTPRIFRQLQKEDLIDPETGLLTGKPWGRVNYSPGDCTTEDEHLHVVWQKGSELRRACVTSRGFSPFEFSSDYIKLNPEVLKLAKLPLAEFRDNWSQSYAAIEATEQLFIAV
jgi:hypothetical protein